MLEKMYLGEDECLFCENNFLNLFILMLLDKVSVLSNNLK